MNLNIVKFVFGLVVLAMATSFAAAPAVAGAALAGGIGAAFMGLSMQDIAQPVPIATGFQVSMPPAMQLSEKILELDNGSGVVVFRIVNGKMATRFYRG